MNPFQTQLNHFIQSLQLRKYATQTVHNYTDHLKLFFQWLMQKNITDLRSVTHELLTQYQTDLAAQPCTPHTIHIKLRSIKRFFDFLEKNNTLLYNPTEKLYFPRLGDRLPKDILTPKEMKQLLAFPNLATMRGLRNRAILELLYSTGLRLSECTGLTLHDIDYQGGYVRVQHGKGGKGRVVPLGTKACEHFKYYLLKVRPRHIKEQPDQQALFLTSYGNALSSKNLSILVREIGREAGIKKPVTVHAIRRAFATHMLQNNAHPLYIQRLLGHSTGATIRKYIKVTGTEVKATHKKTHPREKDKQ